MSAMEVQVPLRRPDSTRERILREASEMFVRRGYSGTSTRDIAAAVGIRQPSLFHHFPNKAAIADELMEYAVGTTLVQIRRIATMDEPASVRLYAFCRWAMVHVVTAPYRLVGLVEYEFLTMPEGRAWLPRLNEVTHYMLRMLSDGMDSGEFIEEDLEFLRMMVVGALNAHHLNEVILERTDIPADAARGADFILRGLLRDSSRLSDIRRDADLLI